MPRKPAKTAEQTIEAPDQGVDQSAPKEPAKKPKIGRPTTFSQHIANIICIRIAEGESLREIVKEDGMPDRSTVYDWLLRHSSFADQYTRAREEQADTLADEIIAIADEQPEVIAVTDKRTGELIEHKLDGAFLQWQKNRIDARKWTAMKLKPKKYGEKVQLAGDSENPLKVEADISIFDALIKNIEAKRQTKAHG